MTGSTLNRTGESPPVVDRGHGTRELGPGDLADTGSDVAGGPGILPEEAQEALGLDPGSTSGVESHRGVRGAGADLGDRNLDRDADSTGTGERDAAGQEAVPANDTALAIVDAEGREAGLVDADDELANADEASPDPVDPLNPNPDEPEDAPPVTPVEEPDDDPSHDRERPRRFRARAAR